jgi:hypothetical protein
MPVARFNECTLTYTGASRADRADRWEIGFDLAHQGNVIATVSLTVTASDVGVADTLGARCLAHFEETGRMLNLPEQQDPERDVHPSPIDSIKALRAHTGKGLNECYHAFARRNEPAFGGDPVLALASLIADERAIEDRDGSRSREIARTLRQDAPALDTLFPLAA